MAEVGRELWRSSGPTPCLKQGHLALAAQARVQMAHDCLQGWRVHHSVGNLCPWSVTLTVKKCFLLSRGNLLCVSLCPWPLVPSLATTGKSLAFGEG